MNLFQLGEFELHSGGKSKWKIECDALSSEEIECLALMLSEILSPFGSVYGIPRGGVRLAKAMEKYITKGPRLLIDDVYTTGKSMYEAWQQDDIGVVIFAKKPTPNWITALFTMGVE